MNKDFEKRDKIIQDNCLKIDTEYLGGIRRFDCLSLSGLEQLIENQFIDLEEQQNSAPTIRKLYEIGKKFANLGYELKYSGYVVSIDRSDYRTSIDEINGDFDNISDNELLGIIDNLSYTADEVLNDRIWWD